MQKFKKVYELQRRACTQIQNFKRNYLESYNDSEHAVKTKTAFFIARRDEENDTKFIQFDNCFGLLKGKL